MPNHKKRIIPFPEAVQNICNAQKAITDFNAPLGAQLVALENALQNDNKPLALHILKMINTDYEPLKKFFQHDDQD